MKINENENFVKFRPLINAFQFNEIKRHKKIAKIFKEKFRLKCITIHDI